MTRPRSFFALMMAFLMAFLVSCSSVEAKVPTTYTAAQIQQIQRYVPTLTEFRSRMNNLGTLIQKKNWIDAKTYIHGPLGELRGTMKTVSGSLLPKSQQQAMDLTKSLFADLVEIDNAAKMADNAKITASYSKAVKDFDTFLQLLPKA
ncbi:MAG: photosystem II protein PsbQ [Microcoleus sp. PH2017_29_MFU_D_A]|jgi:photosystem II protein PsbQ|uniref:photosystem II protein PsbQ n=1 Tax=unclassified Microcoleus TaxID=2642155 RepID=UPI001D5D9DED|nr:MULTISPECIES: photosystem II protein PsbQ [unclassified Microcoleus]MCC3418753.1 photosystem II protein PsbQ [Microcoleus sp. PH2017_07_MST_O_A]MCC3431858.1 photosystem II protein PsbQ [Microcoleus sp. PH2017_04_SCI_O_A]MCC3504570.1 photosystem II protein PsbQ [Microcoleus sp. PH2017_19_SFW_U_A]TAE10038.1 MAG: photosystem II protein PsbQ [Oscillatoriales cyanobacterium]MCC3413292.1 photosystem II protein PsbQ [Microcoleus sp. PH2017_02_FOX_O_A]